MTKLTSKAPGKFLALLAFISIVGLIGCGFSFAPTPSGAVVGRSGVYDYSPSVIQSGDVQQFWWCGQAPNPVDTSQETDSILYESINLTTKIRYGPLVVLAENPKGWDSAYTCNPQVVRGVFVDPLNDGKTYTYAMYYVGTASIAGVNNSIGVAFSNDGISWIKYPQPVIPFDAVGGYGPAQPVPYNYDHKSGIWLFYEDSTPPSNHHVKAASTDGIHFTTQGVLSTNGLEQDIPNASWGDLAYDPVAKLWYATFNLPFRNRETTGNIQEYGQYGVAVYRISDSSLLTGSTPWQQLKTIDTNATGFESNFIAGIARDQYGNVNAGSYPEIQIYTSVSNNQVSWDASALEAGKSADTKYWDIAIGSSWRPDDPPLALNQYFNGKTHILTSGWIDPKGGFSLQNTIGHLYEGPQNGATTAFYTCKQGTENYFVSLDSNCGGAHIIGRNGYGYFALVPGLKLVPLYLCSTGSNQFVSADSPCEGNGTAKPLGYIIP